VLGVVDRHAPGSTPGERGVVDDGHPVVGAVAVLEVQHSRPVVGEILRHLARSATPSRTDISRHVGLEDIATHDVMQMRAGRFPGLDDGVQALDGERGASKAEASVDRGGQGDSNRQRLHLGDGLARRQDWAWWLRRRTRKAETVALCSAHSYKGNSPPGKRHQELHPSARITIHSAKMGEIRSLERRGGESAMLV